MADSIGSQTFVYVKGPMHAPGYEITNISRRNSDGNAWKLEGKRSLPSTLTCFRDVASLAAGHTLRISYGNMKGTIVTIVQSGISYPNMVIQDVEVIDHPQPYANAVGGIAGGTVGVHSVFTVCYGGL